LKEQYELPLGTWIAKSAPGTHKEGAQVSTHPMIMIRSAVTIVKASIYPAFRTFLNILPPNSRYTWAFDACAALVGVFKPVPTLGKIGIKEEAAGKVRLFAMCTAWYQMLLNPLHRGIFLILKTIKQDGTFDQLRPLRDHYRRVKQAFSLDLKTATDRLPVYLQVEILAKIIGRDLAKAWAMLLTDIEYQLKSMKYDVNAKLKYTVGQPMGALSSWAMLALTHHFLVQVAAWKSGVVPLGTWFTGYAILGDDLVIFDRKVANEYLKIIKLIGMQVGLHKSVLSNKHECLTLEFAKRTFFKGVDISPVPILEFTSSLFEWGRAMEFCRKYSLTPVGLAKVLGFRFQNLAKLQSNSFRKLGSKLKMLVIAFTVPTTEEGANYLMGLGAPQHSSFRVSTWEILKKFNQAELGALMVKLDKLAQSHLNSKEGFWNLDGSLISKMSNPPASEEEASKGWYGHLVIRGNNMFYLEPYDINRWAAVVKSTLPVDGVFRVASKAELKEIGKA
jgi:hypothetical protein